MAFNPFIPFKDQLIASFLKNGKRILVSQTCRAAFDHYNDPGKTNILLTHYSDEGLALVHYKAVKSDPFGAMLYLDREPHVAKLREMLALNSKYQVFTSLMDVAQVEERMNLKYTDHIRRYIVKNTTWRIGGDKKINPRLQLIFGELYVLLKYADQSLRVTLTDIEKA